MFPKSAFWKKIRLDLGETKDKGFVSSEDLQEFMNKEGKTLSILRPSGLALIEGKRLVVQSEGVFIPKGKEIIVTRIEGNRVVVREKERTILK
jgi:membrane-bound serine protease (ClpP class)